MIRLVSIILLPFLISGCGGSGDTITSVVKSYTTPQKIHQFDALVETDTSYAVIDTFVDDNITGSGVDVVIAGRKSQPNTSDTHSNFELQLLSWNNGTLVDKTDDWFAEGENQIKGTEPSVHFADFFKTGRNDLFIAHGTDFAHYGPSYVYANTGTSFNRIEISMNNVWAHGSDVGDINGDTYTDIAIVDYGPNTTLAINNQVNNFVTYTDSRGINGDLRYGGSDIVMGDFDADGNTEFIVTDNTCNSNACVGNIKITRMYGYTIDGNNDLNFHFESTLPLPRLDLNDGVGVENHDVRIVAHDFNEDGVDDVIVFSRDADTSNKISEIQFLQNDGTGSFTDVTESILIGYDTNTHSTYRPTFLDINGDGKTDILVSGSDYSGTNNSHQILFKSSDNKYVSAYQNVLKNLNDDIETISGESSDGNTVNIFKAPNGNIYLVSFVQYVPSSSSDRVIDVFLSQLTDTTGVTTAQDATTLLQSTWEYLSTAQANQALLDTSSSYMVGNVINLQQAMQPIGNLTINQTILNGSLIAPGIDSSVFSKLYAVDSIGRDYQVSLDTATNNLSLVKFNDYMAMGKNISSNLVVDTDSTGFLVGDENLYTGSYTGAGAGDWQWTYSRTHMSGQSPWIQLDGVFGKINSSDTSELSIFNNYDETWVQLGWNVSETNITKGLITNVSDIHSVYGVVGHNFPSELNVMLGFEPIIINGDLQLELPQGVDKTGTMQYTKRTMKLENGISPFLSIDKTWQIDDQVTVTASTNYTHYEHTQKFNIDVGVNYEF